MSSNSVSGVSGTSKEMGRRPVKKQKDSSLESNRRRTKKGEKNIAFLSAEGLTSEKKKKDSRVRLNKLNKFVFNKNFICCRESRIEGPNSFYASFYLGPFEESFSVTLAHNLRRTLLSELTGLAIVAVAIDGVSHRFSSLPGVKETTIDVLSNLQNIVLKKTPMPQLSGMPKAYLSWGPNPNGSMAEYQQTAVYGQFNTNKFTNIMTNQIAYLRTRGPGIVTAADIILPSGIECVNPDKHIATLAEDGMLTMRLIITEGKNAIKQKLGSSNSEYNWGIGAYPGDLSSGPNLTLQRPLRGPNKFENSSSGRYAPQKDINPNWDAPASLGPHTSTVNSIELNFAPDKLGPYQEAGVPGKAELQTHSSKSLTNLIYLDSVFMPVTKVNSFVETNPKATDIVLENSPEYTNVNSKTILDIFENFSFSGLELEGSQQREGDEISDTRVAATNIQDWGHRPHKHETILSKNQNFGPKKALFNVVGSSSLIKDSSNPIDSELETNFGMSSQESFFELVPTNTFLEDNLTAIPNLNPEAPTAPKTINLDYHPESTILVNQPKNQCHIVLEIWTNGSLHPREALDSSLDFLTSTFLTLKNVKQLGSMYKSDLTYKKILKENK